MNSQNIRFVLFSAVVVLGMLLYNAWRVDEAENAPAVAAVSSSSASSSSNAMNQANVEIPDKEIPTLLEDKSSIVKPVEANVNANALTDRLVHVKTDVLDLAIDTLGGDVVKLKLTQYAESEKAKNKGFVLLDDSAKRYYIAQSGLTGEDGPDKRGVGRAQFVSSHSLYELAEGQNDLIVELKNTPKEGIDITKRFVFQRGSYAVNVEYVIKNASNTDYKGSFYARLKRKPEPESGGGFLGIQTFTGAAVHTPDTPYKKLSFKDLDSKPFEQTMPEGWAAMVEHYFVSAWIPAGKVNSVYQASKLDQNIYSVGFVEPATHVAPNEEKVIQSRLYAGPEIVEDLEKMAPGLGMSVDYGILWPICQPIFWLLKQIFQFTGNWGVAIILTTVLIKLLFYRLSASSYRSMGNMRKLQPKLEALKARFGDDKQKYSQAVMELYKKEKINPLGGCLPIVVQIPVFIALYYVLLGSVELREAPFILWITDLSAKDPYYVLPIIMGALMLFQQKLNPAPPDPMQAKVMMLMPVVFTVLFLNFPSGLVLYWVVNSLLSIGQQWLITRRIENLESPNGAK